MRDYFVLHLNQNISQSSVPYRLVAALDKVGIRSEILAMHSKVDDDRIHIVNLPIIYRIRRKLRLNIYKLRLKKYPKRKNNMLISNFDVGVNIKNNATFIKSDVVILHWIWGNFVSAETLDKIMSSGKKVIMVCHDNCHFTGGCHVRMGCNNYKNGCGNCTQLESKDAKDITFKQYQKKKRVYDKHDFIVVSPSSWMDNNVASSGLLKKKRHVIIPNPIDTDFFVPQKKGKNSDDGVIRLLFGAVNAVSTPYKGYKELMDTLGILEDMVEDSTEIVAYVFGASGDDKTLGKRIKIHFLGYLDQTKMVDAYNMADVYVVPSLEDSFNNTVAESLATETPVASFATGGIVDIIDHKKNGYLAKYASSDDLAQGIYWIINNNSENILGKNGRQKIKNSFSYEVVGNMYKKLIEE